MREVTDEEALLEENNQDFDTTARLAPVKEKILSSSAKVEQKFHEKNECIFHIKSDSETAGEFKH